MERELLSEDSDRELLNILTYGRDAGVEVRLMRLGGPRQFRSDILSTLAGTPSTNSPSVELLLSDQIPKVWILLASPDDVPFLNRMDAEGASCWKIWRVRRQVRKFAYALVEIGRCRRDPSSLRVAFHKSGLFWNLALAGSQLALVRPYGQGTGHDKSANSRLFSANNDPNLTRSFLGYFESVASHANTEWLSPDDLPDDLPDWPDLYKGNAIRARLSDFDGTDEPTPADDEIFKLCSAPDGLEAELRWLGMRDSLRESLRSLRPVKLCGPFENVRGSGIRIQRISGPSLFDVTACISGLRESNSCDWNRARDLITLIARDSVEALLEFRKVAGHLPLKRKPYPYTAKLRSALSEARACVAGISRTIWENALADASELGRELETAAIVPFRDAHLKNRLWHTSADPRSLAGELLDTSVVDASRALKDHVFDIDFETACNSVTEWDDVFHIVCFEHSAVFFDEQLQNESPLAELCARAEQSLLFWRTGLLRALREHCRRLWYAAVLPKTFTIRYSLETPGYFLHLARLAARRSSGFIGIARLLDVLPADLGQNSASQRDQSGASTLFGRRYGEASQVGRAGPTIARSSSRVRVFVSYSHHDKRHFNRLKSILRLLEREGLVDSWSDEQIRPGQEWGESIEKNLNTADIIVFLVSPDLLYSQFVMEYELPIARERSLRRAAILVPVVVRPISFAASPFSSLQALPADGKPVEKWRHADEAWNSVETSLRSMLIVVREHGISSWLT